MKQKFSIIFASVAISLSVGLLIQVVHGQESTEEAIVKRNCATVLSHFAIVDMTCDQWNLAVNSLIEDDGFAVKGVGLDFNIND